jgi:hypothetical protein
MANLLIVTTSTDPFIRGLDYLYGVRSLALTPDLIDLVDRLDDRIPICTWIGNHIDGVNRQLTRYLQACHDCFHGWEQRPIQIFAAPIAQSFKLDGFCNLQTQPVTILVDVGRVIPKDWLRLVAHEYAHAHVGVPGHHSQFARSLAHLCLGLKIPLPPDQPDQNEGLQFYPNYGSTQDPIAFWLGDGGDLRSLTNQRNSPSAYTVGMDSAVV